MERLTRLTIVQLRAAILRKTGLTHIFVNLVERRTVENRRRELAAHLLACPGQHGLINLAQVHTGRHTQRVEDHIHGTAIRQEREVLLFHNLCHATLVAVTTGHLVTNAQLAGVGDIDFSHLHNAGRKVGADGGIVDLADSAGFNATVLHHIIMDDGTHILVHCLAIVGLGVHPVTAGNLGEIHGLQQLLRELAALRNPHLTGIHIVIHILDGLFAFQNTIQLDDRLLVEAVQLGFVLFFDGKRDVLVLGTALSVLAHTGHRLGTDDHTLHRWGCFQGSVLDIACLVAENGTQQLLLRSRIGLTLRRDLTDEDVTLVDLGTHANQTVGVQVLGSFGGDVRDVIGQFLDTDLGVADLHSERLDMDRSIEVVGDCLFGNHDSILEVVALPGHKRHHQVAAQGQLAVLGGITLRQHIALLHLLAFHHDGAHIDTGVLVRSAELQQLVVLDVGIKAHQGLSLRALIIDFNVGGVHGGHHTIAFRHEHHAGVNGHLVFKAGSHDGSFRTQQGHCLTHHIGAHQGTVGVVVLQERNQGGGDRGNLVGGDVDQVNILTRQDRVVGQTAHLHLVAQQAVLVHRSVGLGDTHIVFLFSGQENRLLVELHLAIHHTTIRGDDETEVVNLGKDAQRGDKADVRTFRGLDCTETAVVGVVHVTHLEAGALTRQTARTQGGDSALVRDLRQGVRLVHKLGELVGAEERVHHGRERLGVDQVRRSEHLVVAHVHLLTDGASHSVQAQTELVI